MPDSVGIDGTVVDGGDGPLLERCLAGVRERRLAGGREEGGVTVGIIEGFQHSSSPAACVPSGAAPVTWRSNPDLAGAKVEWMCAALRERGAAQLLRSWWGLPPSSWRGLRTVADSPVGPPGMRFTRLGVGGIGAEPPSWRGSAGEVFMWMPSLATRTGLGGTRRARRGDRGAVGDRTPDLGRLWLSLGCEGAMAARPRLPSSLGVEKMTMERSGACLGPRATPAPPSRTWVVLSRLWKSDRRTRGMLQARLLGAP
mmetsp:Transcript_2240/g.6341  ORF Transcript_2240/g.6341 Transcript_2240/m.6341 type:complete len:256 (-) Transcript_2240:294-1061(-)